MGLVLTKDNDLTEDFSAIPLPPHIHREAEKIRHIVFCDALIDLLSAHFEISGREIRARNRGAESIARVRQIGMYVAHVVLGINMTEIGEGFGRDKSTVVHACHTIEDMRDDEEFERVVRRFEAITHAAFKFSLENAGWGKNNG